MPDQGQKQTEKADEDILSSENTTSSVRNTFSSVILIVLIGCLLSFLSYYFTSVSIIKTSHVENEVVTKQFISDAFKNSQDVEESVQSIARILELTQFNGGHFDLRALDRFSYAAVFLPNEAGESLVPLMPQLADRYQEVLSSVKRVVGAGIVKSGLDVQIVMDDSLLQIFTSDSVAPLIFMHPLDLGQERMAWLLVVAPFDSILTAQPDVTAKIHVRNVDNKAEVYSYKGRSPNPLEIAYPSQIHQMFFGRQRFEITTQFYKDDAYYLLGLSPYIAAGLVFFITMVIGVIAVYRGKQISRIARMQRDISDKERILKQEIEKRELLNQDLRQSEHENREVIDSISDIIFETDMSGSITYLNAAWPRITGFTIMQSKGKNLFSLLHPQDQKKEQENFDSLVKGQKSAYRTFSRLRSIDGTFRAIELSISMMRRTSDGKMHVVGAITDVEERRRAERALGEAEKKYGDIVQNAAWGIYQMTPEGIYLSANPALVEILGYDNSDEMLHKIRNAHEQVYGNERERKTFLREVDVKGMVNNHETKIFDRKGNALWGSENIRAVKDDSGNVLYYEGSLEDITDRKEADLLLREAKMQSDMANRAKSEFLTNMSHELRTPLNAIIGFSEIIKNEGFGPVGHESYKEYVTDIHTSGQRLLHIINEILDISKIEIRERELNEQVVDLAEVMDASLGLLSNKIQANQTEILNMIEGAPPIIAEDRAMKQIFTNIISNAVKFTPRGGRVTLKHDLTPAGDLLISVTDNGVGLAPDEIKKALSPFGQVGSTLDTDNTGTGLGLTLVRSLVELHGGRLEIFSQKGMGTTVTVRLPSKRVQLEAEQGHMSGAPVDPGRVRS